MFLFAAQLWTFWIQACQPNTMACRSGDEELARFALRAWERKSEGELTLREETRREAARIRIVWDDRRGGLYGEARPFDFKGQPGAEIHVIADTSGMGDAIHADATRDALFRDAVVFLTCLHESGHAFGLSHTTRFDDIMYTFQAGGDIPEYFHRFRRRLRARSDMQKEDAISANDLRRFRLALDYFAGLSKP
jgi:hypothetical protein